MLGGGGVLAEFDAEFKFAKTKFSGKNLPGNGFRLSVPSGSHIQPRCE